MENTKLTSKQMLQKLAEKYEQLFFERSVLQAVLVTRKDSSWIARYQELLNDADLWNEVHHTFLGLYAQIGALTEETDLAALLEKIPEAQKIN